MIKVGITGQSGFIGKHLYNTLGLRQEIFERIDFKKDFFENSDLLDDFVKKCDVIVHLAAVNRHNDSEVIYNTNINLAKRLKESLVRTNSKPYVIFSSSTQEERNNVYGNAKKEARHLLSEWANEVNAKFTGLIIPNVFGPFGNPYYNSVIATFSHQLTHNEVPKIDVDGELKLIYVAELVKEIIRYILDNNQIEVFIQHTYTIKVSEILSLLKLYKEQYFDKGMIPAIESSFELNLFNTFRSYINYKEHYPVKFIKNTDPRGVFVEVIRLGIGGQVSFSTTVPGITRGNHFHTRKIERFAVIKGKALIQLRRIDQEEVLNFHLDGSDPSFVDMPIWYTHNIKNIGEDELYTIFWINEFYDPSDPDTYMIEV